VDGSHALLVDNGAVWVGATRVAAVRWPAVPTAPPALRIHVALAGQAQAQLDAAFAAHGLEPPGAAGATGWLEALRSLAEMRAALDAVASMPRDALLLVDGAVRGLPRHAQAPADRILAAAEARGVTLVAVSKRSGLDEAGTPLVPRLQRDGPTGAWSTTISPGVFVARLHARAAHAFRVDARDDAAIARLVPLCRDAAYCGYPYPLAVAHNRVAITAAEAADLKARLQSAVRAAGGSAGMALLADFHDVLDRNVPG